MNKKVIRILIGIVVFLLVVGGFYIKFEITSNSSVESVLDYGKIEGTVYKNKYFGLTMQLPYEWQVQNKEVMERVRKRGRDFITKGDEDKKATIDEAEHNGGELLTISKYPIGSKHNAIFSSIAEKTNTFRNVKSGQDYLLTIKKAVNNSQDDLAFGDIYSEKIDGIDFGVMEVKFKRNDIVKQKYYATVIKDYIYGFILTYTTQEELNSLNEIVSTMKFSK